jgi:nucleoside-diphosphate-sugar epimerase
MSHSSDLLIIGAGCLGARVAALWIAAHPQARVTAETRSDARHESLRRAGATPRLRTDPAPPTHPVVLLAVPASSPPDYSAEAARAVQLLSGSGRLLITSSTAVYAASRGEHCDEQSELGDDTRARRLLSAEARVLAAGGMVVRLAGLYDQDRGPHRVFLRKQTSPRRPDGLINLIHYDDAAALCVAALERGRAEAIYLGCDDYPLTRQSLVEETHRSPRYRCDGEPCRFLGTEGPLGRRCHNEQTRRDLGWNPAVQSFVSWVRSNPRTTGNASPNS